jgi:tape measure domain-containing protein
MTTETVVLRLELQAAALERKLGVAERRLNGFQGRTKAIAAQVSSHLAGMFAIGAVVAFGRAQLELITRIDASNRALKAITGTALEYERAKKMLRISADEFGVSILDLTKSYVRFYAASKSSTLSVEELDTIFNKITKSTAVLGLSADETSGVLKALEQMLSKAKVQAEELRGQLGDRLPGAFVIMAESMGITTAELDKMLKAGGVMADEVLPRFAEEYEKAIGADAVKKVETLRGAIERLKTDWINSLDDSTEKGILFKNLLDYINDKHTVGRGRAEGKLDGVSNKMTLEKKAELVRKLDKEELEAIEEKQQAHSRYITDIVDGYTKAGKSVDDFIADQKKLIPMAFAEDGIIGGPDLLSIKAEFEERYQADLTAKKEADALKLKAHEDLLKSQLDAEKAFRNEIKKLNEELEISGKMAGYALIEEIKSQAAMLPAAFAVIESIMPSDRMTDAEVDSFFDALVIPDEILEERKQAMETAAKQGDEFNSILEGQAAAMDNIMQNTIGGALSSFAENIGTGDFDKIFKDIAAVIAGGIVDMGKLLIQMGLMEKAFFNAPPGQKIAIGLAAVAIGSAFKKAAARTASVGGGGSGSNNGRGSGFQSTLDGQSIRIAGEFKVSGKDLKVVLNKYDQINSRAKVGG